MVLRRLTQHVKEQNWIAVGIDFAIVVIGVYMGLQVQQWSETRGDRGTEARYLRELTADLTIDSNEFATLIVSNSARVAAINYILQEALGEAPPDSISLPTGALSGVGTTSIPLPKGSPPSDNDSQLLWAIINFDLAANANRAAYDALVSTGNIGLMQDHELVRSIQSYYNMFEGLETVQIHFLGESGAEVISQGRERGLSPYGSVEEERLFDLVRASPELAASLREVREMATLHSTFVKKLEERASRLLSILQKED